MSRIVTQCVNGKQLIDKNHNQGSKSNCVAYYQAYQNPGPQTWLLGSRENYHAGVAEKAQCYPVVGSAISGGVRAPSPLPLPCDVNVASAKNNKEILSKCGMLLGDVVRPLQIRLRRRKRIWLNL